MVIFCQFQPEDLYTSVHELIRMTYPGCKIELEDTGETEVCLRLKVSEKGKTVFIEGEIISPDGKTSSSENFELAVSVKEKHKEAKKLARIFMYKLLCRHRGQDINTYGILTGVRPVKLVHKLLDQGDTSASIVNKLKNEYHLNAEKAELLMEIAGNNRSFLLTPEAAAENISIYIGIPYCPTRCYYCSFPGAVLHDYQADLKPFLEALTTELEAVGTYLQQNNINIQSIYIGGGTPTVLSEADIWELFNILHKKYISAATAEITVEAGRPDTLSPLKCKVLEEAGVSRICINPQTMNDSTLKRIGRNHSAKGVVQSVEWAREAGIKQINMDLIVGLPGEHIQENAYTAEQILKLNPENITVHTLALKRGSAMAETEPREYVTDRVAEVEKGVDFFASVFRKAGYMPYYLYRQKYMKANMENTGYSVFNNFCLYNIQMIEERQTIIGMGGGAASKFVNVSDWTLSSFYNPKNPQTYCESVEKLIRSKVDKLRALN